MASVEVSGLTKRFEQVTAVDHIDLIGNDGEFLVLLGPSGCGKTTLLRMIGGLEQVTEGEIRIGGRVVNSLPPRARNIAMVFQSYALYPHMTVRDNIAFPLKAQHMPKDEQKRRIEWASGMLGIEMLLDRRPRQLSGGQRQRVALARALVREPDVFLLDEPLSNLDAQRRASARDELEQFHKRIGTTTIYVTHDQVEAMGMGDRIAVINGGQLLQLGTPFEIYDQPADTFVATFLGSPPMNLLERDGHYIGFRPEHFAPKELISSNGSGPPLMVLPFHVMRQEYLGAERLVYGEVEGTKVMTRFPANLPVAADPGQTFDYAVRQSDLRFFDKATGRRREGPR